MRYYLLCGQCEWSFTIDHLVESAECPSCGEFVLTDQGTQRYSERHAETQNCEFDKVAATGIEPDQPQHCLTRQQKAALQKEEYRRERELAAKAVQEKQAAEKVT